MRARSVGVGAAGRFLGAILIASFALGGCAAERAQLAYRARSELIGLTRASLYECAGPPAHRELLSERELLTYVSGPVDDPETCVATFVLRRELVERVDYTSPSGRLVRRAARCSVIVDPCFS